MATTEFNFKEFAQLLDLAQISAAEAAELFRTTRTTVYHWRRGNAPAQEVVRLNALGMIRLIKLAVATGDLPLGPVERVDRVRYIKEALAKHRH